MHNCNVRALNRSGSRAVL